MENQKQSSSKDNISSALASKWSKLTSPEIKEIVNDHKKLTGVLEKRYSLSHDDAVKKSQSFLKPFE